MKRISIVMIAAALVMFSGAARAFDGVSYHQWQSWTIAQKATWLDSFRGGFCAGAMWAADFHDKAGAVKVVFADVDEALSIKYGEAVALIDFQWLQQGYDGKALQIVAAEVFRKLYDSAFWKVSESARKGGRK